MPSTYSSLLRLELMATGEKSATWGDITNTNLGTLLEKSIAGLASVNVTAGNVTLTALNGTDDESRCAVISVTGTPGVSRNVVAPSSAKLYAVINGSNAAIVFKGAATTGVTLSAGEKAWLAWNGSDFVQIGVPQTSPTFFGQVIGPAGTVGTPSYSFTGDLNTGWWAPAADTQAWSTAGSERLRVNNTGQFTQNGTAVGIAANANTALTLAMGTSAYLSAKGSGGQEMIAGADTSGVVVGSYSNHQLVLRTNNIDRVTINTSGDIGFGTTPTQRLTVSSPNPVNGYVAGLTNSQSTAGRTGTFLLFDAPGLSDWKIGIPPDVSAFTFYDVIAAAERMRIDSSGNVGIGISNPGTKLDVVGQIRSKNASGDAGGLRMWSDVSGNGNLFEYFNAALIFGTNDTERARIDASGNLLVGIATGNGTRLRVDSGSAPWYTFSASSASASYGQYFRGGTTTIGGYIGFDGGALVGTGTGTGFVVRSEADLILMAGAAEKVRVDSSGNVGVGGVAASGIRFHVTETAATPARAALAAAAGQTAYLSICGNALSPGVASFDLQQDSAGAVDIVNRSNTRMSWYTNGTERLRLNANGSLYGTALHNVGTPTGTTTQYIASGTYTPTISNTTNVSASTARKSQWTRVGNVVTVSVTVTTTQTNVSAVTEIGVSLPITSNLATTYDLSGTGFRYDAAGGGGSVIRVIGDVTNDRATLNWISNTSANTSDLTAVFTYEVL